MSAFATELQAVVGAQAQAARGAPDLRYALPWYLVIGRPGSGRSTAIKAMNLSWPWGDGPVAIPGESHCTYWMPEHAVFIEPGHTVVGGSKQAGKLDALAGALKAVRPREPIDGIILVISVPLLAEATEDQIDDYAKELRKDLLDVGRALGTDIPIYAVVSGYDDLWGFGDAFRWSAMRVDEDPWGFNLPVNLTAAETPERVHRELDGLIARVESMCFDKIASEGPADERMRAFQHLVEATVVINKLGELMKIVTMDNAFERAPWMRALAIGSGVPNTGHRLRYDSARMATMGFLPPGHSGTLTPGGMPLHQLLDRVLIPERDIVPTHKRWRDDIFMMLMLMVGGVLWLGITILFFAR
jgi:type VI secretion system protein ImpL